MAEAGSSPVFSGPVETGDARGRTIGFPTANVAVDGALLQKLPRGVHAGSAAVGGIEYGAVINIGERPTFGADRITVEVHLLDFTGDIYGEELTVRLLAKLREEEHFDRPDQLVEQIRTDVTRARAILAGADGAAGTGGRHTR